MDLIWIHNVLKKDKSHSGFNRTRVICVVVFDNLFLDVLLVIVLRSADKSGYIVIKKIIFFERVGR